MRQSGAPSLERLAHHAEPTQVTHLALRGCPPPGHRPSSWTRQASGPTRSSRRRSPCSPNGTRWTNLTMRLIGPLFGVSHSAAHRVIDTLGPLLAVALVRRRPVDQLAIVDGTLIPTRDHRLADPTTRHVRRNHPARRVPHHHRGRLGPVIAPSTTPRIVSTIATTSPRGMRTEVVGCCGLVAARVGEQVRVAVGRRSASTPIRAGSEPLLPSRRLAAARRLVYKLCASRPHTSRNGRTLGASSMSVLLSVLPSGAVAVSVAVDSHSAARDRPPLGVPLRVWSRVIVGEGVRLAPWRAWESIRMRRVWPMGTCAPAVASS